MKNYLNNNLISCNKRSENAFSSMLLDQPSWITGREHVDYNNEEQEY